MPPRDHLRPLLDRLTLLVRADDRRAAGLQPIHMALLRYVAAANRYSNTPAAAAEYLGQTRGSVSQSLALLERRRLLRRDPDPADGRRVRLRLTARGRRLIEGDADGLRAALAAVPHPVAARLAEGLGTLLEALQGATGGRRFGVCRGCGWLQQGEDGLRCGKTRDALEEHETGQLCLLFEP